MKVLKYLHKTGLKLVGLEINKGIDDEYLCTLHGSVVELHVGGTGKTGLIQPSRQRWRLYHAGV